MEQKIIKIQQKLKEELDKERYEHTLGVMYTSAALAMCHGANMDQALLAGLLHDCAKCISGDKKVKLCRKYHLEISEVESKNPSLLHAKLGAFLAKKKYHVQEKEILDAIASHTTGRPGMTLLEKIIYIADYMEPGRDSLPNMAEVRCLAFRDIDECLYRILKDSLDYLKKKDMPIDRMTEQTYDYYKKQRNKQGEIGGNGMDQTLNMVRTVCCALEEKKGEDIRPLDISHVSVMADYFVITNGTSSSQVRALVENVDEKMQKAGYRLKQQEGKDGAWVLMDYGDVIVHIFDKESRSFYNLERIWSDGTIVENI